MQVKTLLPNWYKGTLEQGSAGVLIGTIAVEYPLRSQFVQIAPARGKNTILGPHHASRSIPPLNTQRISQYRLLVESTAENCPPHLAALQRELALTLKIPPAVAIQVLEFQQKGVNVDRKEKVYRQNIIYRPHIIRDIVGDCLSYSGLYCVVVGGNLFERHVVEGYPVATSSIVCVNDHHPHRWVDDAKAATPTSRTEVLRDVRETL